MTFYYTAITLTTRYKHVHVLYMYFMSTTQMKIKPTISPQHIHMPEKLSVYMSALCTLEILYKYHVATLFLVQAHTVTPFQRVRRALRKVHICTIRRTVRKAVHTACAYVRVL